MTAAKIERAYVEMTKFLPAMPMGITLDVLQSRIPALKQLSSGEMAQLLIYTTHKGEITVVPGLQKGLEASPLLKMKQKAESLSLSDAVSQSFEQKTNQQPGLPNRIVFASGPGNVDRGQPTANTLRVGAGEYFKTTEETPTEESKVEQITVKNIAALAAHLHDVAKATLKDILNSPQGITRTELDARTPGYRKLDVVSRNQLLAFLCNNEGIVDQKDPRATDKRAARVLIHPKYLPGYVEPVAEPKPADSTTSASRLFMQSVAILPDFDGDDTDTAESDADKEEVSYVQIMEVAKKMKDVVDLAPFERGITLRDMHDALPEFHALAREDRDRAIRMLLDWKEVRSVKDFVGVGYNGPQVMFLRLINKPEPVAAPRPGAFIKPEPVDVKQTPIETDKPVEQPVTRADHESMYGIKHPTTILGHRIPMPAITQAAALNASRSSLVSKNDGVVEPVKTAAEIRAEAEQLMREADRLERAELDADLLEQVMPIRDEIVTHYSAAQRALESQIDSLSLMGIAIEKLNGLLGGVKK
jgi:hypothetical protein